MAGAAAVIIGNTSNKVSLMEYVNIFVVLIEIYKYWTAQINLC